MPPPSYDPSTTVPLRRSRDFRALWAAQAASQLGERSATLVIPLIAVGVLAASATDVGILRAVSQAPALLLALALGALADRWDPRLTMIVPDVVRLVIAMIIIGSWLLGWLSLPVLLIGAFVIGTMSLIFDLGYQLSLVRLVRRDQFGVANSALETARSGTQLVGPAATGTVVSWLSAPVALLVPALVWLAAALLSTRVRLKASDTAATPTGRTTTGHPPMITAAREGLRVVWDGRILRSIAFASATFQFGYAAVTTVQLVFWTQTLQLSGVVIGLILAALGPGAVVGSVLGGWLPRRLGFGVVIAGPAVVTSAVVFVLPFVGGGAAVVILIMINVIIGACIQLIDIQMTSVRQAVTPLPLQGRVISTVNMMGIGLAPIGSLAGGWLADQWQIRGALLVAASPLVILISPLSRIGRRLPDPDEPS